MQRIVVGGDGSEASQAGLRWAVEEATRFSERNDAVGEIYRALPDKTILHLALLIHDLGKGFEEDHSEVGRRIAKSTAKRFHLPAEPAETLEFLVHKHLRMSHLALKHDTTQPQLVASTESSHDRCWKLAGMKLEPAQRSQLGIHSTRYRGGMRVLDVRGESPSAKAGIRQGDILVGLHQWETISQDNMSYIFNHKQLATFGPLKFYVLRGAETLYGNVTLPTDAK